MIARLAIGLTFYASAPALPVGIILAQEPAVHKLNITIIEGEGAINNIKSRVAREPIVEVTDENHKPVGGAILVFTTPNSGPSGIFANGSRMLTVTTDQNGRGVASGLRPNNRNGRFQISVKATLGGLTATATITQLNSGGGGGAGGAGGGHGGLFGIGVPWTIAVVAGVAAVTAVVLTKTVGGGNGRRTTVSVGPPTLP